MKDQARLRQIAQLGRVLGLEPSQIGLLDLALTHPTYAYEHGTAHNQRLEFLGDAVLGLVMATELYRAYPDEPEGRLTKMRAALVCEESLARKAGELQLGRYLLLGRGEEQNGGRDKPSILSDAFEAVVAAIYLDAGLSAAQRLIRGCFAAEIRAAARQSQRDFKTALQELLQREGQAGPSYVLLAATGPDHDKRFTVGVKVGERVVARGRGRSKKEAEQLAAQAALGLLGS